MEAKLRKQQQESEIDSKWLHQEENNLKKRLSLITAGSNNSSLDLQTYANSDGNGPLSGSYHSSITSPQPQMQPDHQYYPTSPNLCDSRLVKFALFF